MRSVHGGVEPSGHNPVIDRFATNVEALVSVLVTRDLLWQCVRPWIQSPVSRPCYRVWAVLSLEAPRLIVTVS